MQYLMVWKQMEETLLMSSLIGKALHLCTASMNSEMLCVVKQNFALMQTKFICDNQINISKPVELELFGLAQEALNNSIKHGAATSVTIRLTEKDGFIMLEIRDNGKGFDLQKAENKHGAGLISMNKRVENLGGQLNIITAPKEGTCIQVFIPKYGSYVAQIDK